MSAAGTRATHVHEAHLRLAEDDPAAVGARITAALCGHWEHDGPCRWPHNNQVTGSGGAAVFRTVFVCDADDEPEVRGRIEAALADDERWTLVSSGPREPAVGERSLGERLAATPRP